MRATGRRPTGTGCVRPSGPCRWGRRRNSAMRIGVFDNMDRGDIALPQFFADRMQLIEMYDRAGFYGYHVAQPHATPLGMAPAPGIWLAAIAARTEQLRFGRLWYRLPLYHPIKLLEEISMLDQMS